MSHNGYGREGERERDRETETETINKELRGKQLQLNRDTIWGAYGGYMRGYVGGI